MEIYLNSIENFIHQFDTDIFVFHLFNLKQSKTSEVHKSAVKTQNMKNAANMPLTAKILLITEIILPNKGSALKFNLFYFSSVPDSSCILMLKP